MYVYVTAAFYHLGLLSFHFWGEQVRAVKVIQDFHLHHGTSFPSQLARESWGAPSRDLGVGKRGGPAVQTEDLVLIGNVSMEVIS